MSATSLFEKEAAKKTQFFIFLKGCYFVMGKPLGMTVGVF